MAQANPEHIAALANLAENLDVVFNGPKVPGRVAKQGFMILAFPFDGVDGGNLAYISNASDETMRRALTQLLRQWDKAVFIPQGSV